MTVGKCFYQLNCVIVDQLYKKGHFHSMLGIRLISQDNFNQLSGLRSQVTWRQYDWPV